MTSKHIESYKKFSEDLKSAKDPIVVNRARSGLNYYLRNFEVPLELKQFDIEPVESTFVDSTEQ